MVLWQRVAMMSKLNSTGVILAGSLAVLASGTTPALSASSDEQIELLRQQVRLLEKKLDNLERKANSTARESRETRAIARSAVAAPAAKVPVVRVKDPAVVTMPNNRPTICSEDGYNCLAITGRLHFDAGGYDYRPNTALTIPQTLNDGVNARRARIGVTGRFARDWDYALIYDFGGTQDGTGQLENAFLTYRGFRDFYNLAIDGGYLDVPYTLDEATSSNNIMFMERASSQTLAVNFAAGDFRAAFGAHVNDKQWWAGAYVTGPQSGAPHNQRVPYGATARGVYVPINNDAGSLLLGADFQYLASTGGPPGVNNLTVNDRVELRIDPTATLLSTGLMSNVQNATVWSGELAGGVGSFYFQGEYYNYAINRYGESSLNFGGGYIQASYTLTGERRKYIETTGSYSGITPVNPYYYGSGGWGAWEIAGRFSQVSLDDALIRGGNLKSYTLGLNWYVSNNVRFMFNWVNGEVAKTTLGGMDVGAKYNAFGMRTQIAW